MKRLWEQGEKERWGIIKQEVWSVELYLSLHAEGPSGFT